MADLIAIGYDDETTAAAAADEVAPLSKDAEHELQDALHGSPAGA